MKITHQDYSYVRQAARRFSRRLPAHVAVEDIVSAGFVGLMESAGRYDPGRSHSFHVYAGYRVKGAILDALRAADRLPKDQRARARHIERARRRCVGRLGRPPEPDEMAAE